MSSTQHAQYNGLQVQGAAGMISKPSHAQQQQVPYSNQQQYALNGQGALHSDPYASGYATGPSAQTPGQFANHPGMQYSPLQTASGPGVGSGFPTQQITQQMGGMALSSPTTMLQRPTAPAAQYGTAVMPRPAYGGQQQQAPLGQLNPPSFPQQPPPPQGFQRAPSYDSNGPQNLPPGPYSKTAPYSSAQPPSQQLAVAAQYQTTGGFAHPDHHGSLLAGAPPPPSSAGYQGQSQPPLPPTGLLQHQAGGGLPPPPVYGGTYQGPPGIRPQSQFSSQVPSGMPSYSGGPAPPAPLGATSPPGYGAAPPGAPSTGYGYGGQTAPSSSLAPPTPKRLDPDQMPSPIQVILDDRKNRKGAFPTNTRGQVPPLVTTDFVAQDHGNCNPRFLRSTMYCVPVSNDMMKQAKIPFGLVASPYARLASDEAPPPCVNLGELGPVRCNRCRAYMCPFMQFVDGGRRFQCPFCNAVTDVPQEYFAHLDHTGKRVDTYERPELCLGSYEILATKDYCKNGVYPTAPAFIFMIDVSYNSVKSGLVHLLCRHIKEDVLPNLPKEPGAAESSIRVGFATYSNVLHFYNVKGTLAQPQMLVVSDVDDVFVPMVDGFLVQPSEACRVIDSLMEQLPAMFADSRETEVVLGPVIQAGMDAVKSAGCPGKLFIFHTSLPIANAPGKLKNRDDRKLLGTDKEKSILTPQDSFYTKLGLDCTAAGCGVDLFLFPNSYIDVATVAEVPRLTGGQVYKYEYFQADLNGDRFLQDLKNAVQKPIAFDCILRVRTSTGIRPVDFFGNFTMSNTTDVEMAVLDCDKSFCCEVKHDDKLTESDGAFVQVAMLFTSMGGQRKLRVHNLSLNCCTQMADLFRSCELDTLVNLLSKIAIRNTLLKTPKDVREEMMQRCSEILAAYRKYCATPSSAGQLILPECMKLLPLYTNCIIRSDALQGGADISTDDRSYLMHLLNGMDVAASAVLFYPRLLPLHTVNPDDASDTLPDPIRCSIERMSSDGVYLLENGVSMFLWLGVTVSAELVQSLFDAPTLSQLDTEKAQLVMLDNPISRRICGIVNAVRQERQRYMKLTVVRQGDKLEPWFRHFLVEDKDSSGASSYVDFLCHIHREIRNLLS